MPIEPWPAQSLCDEGVTLDSLSQRHFAILGVRDSRQVDEIQRILTSLDSRLCPVTDPLVDLVIVGDQQLQFEVLQTLLDTPTKLDDAGRGRLQMMPLQQLYDALGLVEDLSDTENLYTAKMLADILGLPLATIRSWHRRNLIQAVHRIKGLDYFDFQEVSAARQLAQLVAAGFKPDAIQNQLAQLSRFLPNVRRPLAQLAVLVEGKRIFLRRGGGLMEPDGQRRIDFQQLDESDGATAEDSPASIPIHSEVSDGQHLTTPDEFIRLAEELEEQDVMDEAIEVYRSLHLAFGPRAETNFRLGELFYLLGEVSAARERYYMSIELDETFVEARASLGCVLMELGELEPAIAAFQGALHHHDDYADVHYHLAHALEQSGRPEQAAFHWQRFVDLCPDSPWTGQAQERISIADRHDSSGE